MFSVFRAGCETELKLSPKLQLLLQETGYFQLPDLQDKEVRMSCFFFFLVFLISHQMKRSDNYYFNKFHATKTSVWNED